MGVKRSLVRRSLSSGYHVKSRSYSCKQIFQPRSFFFSFFAVFLQHGTNSTLLNFICVCYQGVAGTHIVRRNADKEWLTKEGGLLCHLLIIHYYLFRISFVEKMTVFVWHKHFLPCELYPHRSRCLTLNYATFTIYLADTCDRSFSWLQPLFLLISSKGFGENDRCCW